jgi:predicted Rossmann fold nucleotide-binding protein DprA/Smf involved in DNA uptake
MQSEINPDTQVALLLTGRFSRRSDDGLEPLTVAEYNLVALALIDAGLRPADLLEATREAFLEGMSKQVPTATSGRAVTLPEAERIRQLLERSVALALAVEAWASTGIWVLGRSDEDYPERLRQRLKGRAPIVLFGCGEVSLLERGGLAVVGSRSVDEAGARFAAEAASSAAAAGMQVISGGARGVDSIAMESGLARGGSVLGVLANDLDRTSRFSTARTGIDDGLLCLVSASQPDARFEAWRAMDRNKVIYALSDWALVVATDKGKGGTWAGAKENLTAGWVPLYVHAGDDAPAGNRALLDLGGRSITRDSLPCLKETLLEGGPVTQEGAGSSEQATLF